jgi:hypothetical protein
MQKVEMHIIYVIAVFFLYGVVVTRAYLDQRKNLRYYKRHYDSLPKKHKRHYQPSVCQRVIDYLMIISPIK